MSIGRIIAGRYELQERLGSGAFFMVFKGRERTTGRPVAVSMLQPETLEYPAFCEALRQGMRGMEDLAHPGIVRIHELVEDEGPPVVVSEFVRGINLKERIKRIAPFTVSVAVDFAIAVCEALQYAHGSGVVHGDVRPHNVIVSPDGVVKLTGFGIARAVGSSTESSAKNLGRAVHYQGPEIAAQGVALASTDLYALGAMLFEMLTGSTPYPGDSPLHVAAKHQNDPVPSPRSLNPGVPRALDGIVRKSLQKRPEDRYRSAADMLADLKSVRDALRFGRAMTWSPMEEPVPEPEPAPVKQERSAPVQAKPKPAPTPERTLPMGRTTRARDDDNRVSPVLRVFVLAMLVVVLLLGVFGAALWMAAFTKPESKVFPDLVGKQIEEARTAAAALKVKLLEREDFNDRYDPGVVYRVDYEVGSPIRPGRTVLIWVSRGSRLVWVPDVGGLSAGEAETKLKGAGLSLGRVDRTTSGKVPFGCIVSQNPRSGKRVDRDTPVALVISDGPEGGMESSDGLSDDRSPDAEHEWSIAHTVRRDGLGARQVRVEYEDSQGTGTVFDDVRDEGDVVELQVRAQGPTLIVRVYYDDSPTPVSERTVPWRSSP